MIKIMIIVNLINSYFFLYNSILLLYNARTTIALGSDPIYGSSHRKCERITIPMCKDVPYNATRMPNFIGHYTQSEAAIMVRFLVHFILS